MQHTMVNTSLNRALAEKLPPSVNTADIIHMVMGSAVIEGVQQMSIAKGITLAGATPVPDAEDSNGTAAMDVEPALKPPNSAGKWADELPSPRGAIDGVDEVGQSRLPTNPSPPEAGSDSNK